MFIRTLCSKIWLANKRVSKHSFIETNNREKIQTQQHARILPIKLSCAGIHDVNTLFFEIYTLLTVSFQTYFLSMCPRQPNPIKITKSHLYKSNKKIISGFMLKKELKRWMKIAREREIPFPLIVVCFEDSDFMLDYIRLKDNSQCNMISILQDFTSMTSYQFFSVFETKLSPFHLAQTH
mmetsp:Transcript_11120/g.16370  ORF Transcript_11120/g.16370 Transcript_11120/m.16370 type:complete len:180 (+) Transcript_11120:119-658(+)